MNFFSSSPDNSPIFLNFHALYVVVATETDVSVVQSKFIISKCNKALAPGCTPVTGVHQAGGRIRRVAATRPSDERRRSGSRRDALMPCFQSYLTVLIPLTSLYQYICATFGVISIISASVQNSDFTIINLSVKFTFPGMLQQFILW